MKESETLFLFIVNTQYYLCCRLAEYEMFGYSTKITLNSWMSIPPILPILSKLSLLAVILQEKWIQPGTCIQKNNSQNCKYTECLVVKMFNKQSDKWYGDVNEDL